MERAKRDELTAKFKAQVTDNAKRIDPDNEHDWESIALGWSLGQGLELNAAREFVTHLTFNTKLL